MARVLVIVPFPLDESGIGRRAAQLAAVQLGPGIEFDFRGVRAGPALLDSGHDTGLAELALAEVGELQRAPRPRAELLDCEDPDVVEREPQAGTCSLRAAASIIAVSISSLGTFGGGHAFFECETPSPSTSSASL